jgi:phage gpG-like protein
MEAKVQEMIIWKNNGSENCCGATLKSNKKPPTTRRGLLGKTWVALVSRIYFFHNLKTHITNNYGKFKRQVMSVTLTLKINGAEKASEALSKLALKAEDVPSFLDGLGKKLEAVTLARFESQTDPQGKAWQKLAPLTIALRGSGGKILTRSGHLKGNIEYDVNGTTLSLGPNTPYGAIQQYGGTIKAKNASGRLWIPTSSKAGNKTKRGFVTPQSVTLPPRPYIGFGDKDESATRFWVEDYFSI